MGFSGDDDAPLRVKKMSEHATIPSRGSDGAAGYDLSRYANDAMRSRTVGGRSVVDRWSIGGRSSSIFAVSGPSGV